MVVLDVNHPEIEDFVEWKALEEDKVRALGKAGYDTSMNGEAYKTVSGQNSNNSVRVDHEFMTKKNDPEADYTLYGLTDPEVNKTVKAYDLWKKINEAAWKCADPGLQFSDTINAWNTCLNDDIIRASNPCSEFVFLDNTACNLASINLLKFLNKDGSFDIDSFLHIIGLVQLVLEASIHWGQYPTKAVAERSYLYRPTGLGLTNYASLFLAMGLAYDSDEARALAATLTGIMTGYSYCVSTKMAKEIGPFEKYEYNKTSMLDVICNHAIVAGCPPYSKCIDNGFLNIQPLKVDREKVPKDLSECLNKVWCRAFNDGQRYGFRNSQVSCIAPTGTISFAMDCGATSIEPFFSHKVYKKCSDGSTMEIINPLADEYLNSESYPILKLQDIENYFNENNTYQGCPELTEHDQKVLETANEVSPEAHVKMVAAVTPLISGAVSKTINLPNTATVEDIMAINDLAYKLGVKAITVYRDGCKASQPLNTSIDEDDKEEEIEETKTRAIPERIKPSPIRNSRTHVVQIESLNLYITVGYYDNGDLAELFISTDKEGTTIKGLLSALSKAISYMLQFGIEPQEISKMLRGHKFEPAGIVAKHPNIKFVDSIADLISKIIDIECGNYNYVQVKDEINKPVFIKEPKEIEEEPERIYGETCPNCGSSNLVKTGVCKTCNDCGSTTGCS